MDIQISTGFEREAEVLTLSRSSLEVKLREGKAELFCSTASSSAYTACAMVRQQSARYGAGLKWGIRTLCREGERRS